MFSSFISKYIDGMKDEATEDSFSPTHSVSIAERRTLTFDSNCIYILRLAH